MSSAPSTSLARLATGLPRYFMDCGWYRHPRFAGLPIEALFVFEAAVGYSTQHGSDGELPADHEDLSLALGIRAAVVKKAINALIERQAVEVSCGRLVIRGWESHNPTSAEVRQRASERSASGSLGNHRRWHEQKGEFDANCQFCVATPDR